MRKLQPYNFQKVYFEECDYETQINIARNCRIMIGYHGAGLTNLFFMKSNSLVLEIFNKNYQHKHFKFFSKALKINYKSFKCSKNHLNLDGVCDIKEITNYIKKKLR
jgi:capsular polysaccharide biosynthesis protein